ncbi:von Willebrand factor A domain-containing protein 7-like [Silurus meridionalis]|uniref:von Willebrand factor A domain-containing protein 7-like n=1 Tax=Silurus meridionalis TaxID=175797 RepID=UPI001EEBEE8B|nr:von Willebrand factor A domain-containing protein 7-like [Silurus meridionalis]
MIKTNLLISTLIYPNLIMILMTSQTLAFMPALTKPMTHQDITRVAVLQTTADVCRSQALQKGWNFVMPNPLTVKSVAESCYSSDSAKDFQSSLNKINHHNAWVDFWNFFTPSYHFDNEMFLAGRKLITDGVSVVKYSVKKQSYQTAREALGKVLHTLQDFYSHSNWIELGKTQPYSNLIKPDTLIENIADSETCSKCSSSDCIGNILEVVITQNKLTSGYFGLSKPKGKCSHGGLADPSSWWQGGINKDSSTSSHGYLHSEAASVATAATKELLQDIRASVGDSEFLRLMGLTQSSVLCFVIDTTGSMSDDIAEVRRVTSSIIDSKTGTEAQPSEYILVPFNDPDFGPLTRTTDPIVFKKKLNALTANGGGDAPEMSLSGLQLALTGSPPQMDIFVFTDADAKDKELTSTVRALIERTKSKVTFMLTNGFSFRRRRSAVPVDGQQQVSTRVVNVLNKVYKDLAEASGGQAIEVTKGTLSQATDIIAAISRSTLVIIFQAIRNPGKPENFPVFVDSSVKNLTIYITGSSPYYNITSPSGVSQSSTELIGSLGIIQKVGNFHKVQPSITEQTGEWLFSINSTQSYTIKVVGQSDVDFLFEFIELSQGPHPSYTVLNSRPAANNNITLLVTMVGVDNVRPTEVSLIQASNSNSVNGTLEEVSSGQYLVTFNGIPAGEFTVGVVGQLSSTRSLGNTFQRQTPTQFQTSTVTIMTQPVGTAEPGKQLILPFTVATNGSGGNFTISVNNDQNFDTRYNTSITVNSGDSTNGTVTLTVPNTASSGTDVTLTIQAEAPGGSDSNYAVLRIAVIAPVTDFTPPVCEAVNLNANCSGNCNLSTWYLTANVTDRSGSGVENVRVLYGNGNLSTTTVLNDTGVNVTMVIYSSSCCSSDLELVAVDAEGNVATCYTTSRAASPVMANETTTITTTKSTSTTSGTTNRASTNGVECCLFLLVFLRLNMGVL